MEGRTSMNNHEIARARIERNRKAEEERKRLEAEERAAHEAERARVWNILQGSMHAEKRRRAEAMIDAETYGATAAGNEKYQALDRAERQWLKGSKRCGICGHRHPPMKYDGSKYEGPQLQL